MDKLHLGIIFLKFEFELLKLNFLSIEQFLSANNDKELQMRSLRQA